MFFAIFRAEWTEALNVSAKRCLQPLGSSRRLDHANPALRIDGENAGDLPEVLDDFPNGGDPVADWEN